MNENEKREIPFAPNYYIDKHGLVYHNNTLLKLSSRNGNNIPNYVSFRCLYKGRDGLHKFNIAKLMGIVWLRCKDDDVICFKDGDLMNTELDNLYIGDRSTFLRDNFNYKVKNGLTSDRRLTREEHRNNAMVYQVDPDTYEIISTYKSLVDASRKLDIPVASLEHSCFFEKSTCLHYKWIYAEDYDDWVQRVKC